MCGASSYKGTAWLTNCVVDPLPACDHPSHDWVVPADGQTYNGPHMRLTGKAPAVRLTDYFKKIDPNVQPDFLTKRAAAYPARANRWLVSALATARSSPRSSSPRQHQGNIKEQRYVR